ncbi:MAG: GLUG motif-containing protein [Candidatus Hydrogenedentales bacterium]|jgi:hypothetical protein
MEIFGKRLVLSVAITAIVFSSANLFAQNAIKIGNITDLQKIGKDSGFPLNREYELTQNIDASATAEWNDGAGFEPIGTEDDPFTGIINGKNRVITGLTINRPEQDCVGLFGYVNGAEIKNIILTGASVTGNDYVGGFIGRREIKVNDDDEAEVGILSSCSFSGEVQGESYVAGLVGWNYGSIINSNVTADIVGNAYVGGIAGFLAATEAHATVASINNCAALGEVTGETYVGGLVGYGNGRVMYSHAANGVFGTIHVGGLVGENYMFTISDSYSTGTVKTGDFATGIGGLIGVNSYGTVRDCYATGDIVADDNSVELGGLLGKNLGIIEGCHAQGTVTGGDNSTHLGGFIGYNGAGQISNSSATGDVYGGGDFMGGFIGENNGSTINRCFSSGAVIGGVDFMGGFIGENVGDITDCYATGNVSGTGNYRGGLIGNIGDSDVSNCYAIGEVSDGELAAMIGGLLGNMYMGTVYWSFWNVETSGQEFSAGGQGLTTEAMLEVFPFQDAGWGYDGNWEKAENAYPRLSWEGLGLSIIPLPGDLAFPGSGIEGDPYSISTPEEFAQLSNYARALNAHFVLTADLDLSGQTLSPLGDTNGFQGTFDGAGFVLYNGVLNLPNGLDVGLFSKLAEGASITNLRVENIMVAGTKFVGGLVAKNFGTIIGCTISGEVSCTDTSVGGLVGVNSGHINGCSSAVNVSGGTRVGGLVGFNSEVLVDCSATGTVSGNSRVGGLVGLNNNTITDSWASGDLLGTSDDIGGFVGAHAQGTLSNCFATGTVTGTGNNMGGLIGLNSSEVNTSFATGAVTGNRGLGGFIGANNGTVNMCYATGAVEGSLQIGGFIGWNSSGSINNCYATGAATGNIYIGGFAGLMNGGGLQYCYAIGTVTGYGYYFGGLVGSSSVTISNNNYWDIERTGQTSSVAGQGRTTAQMVFPYGGTSYGSWNFQDIWAHDTCRQLNKGYPFLAQVAPEFDENVPLCDDGIDCTVDSCDPELGCINDPDDTRCDLYEGDDCWTATCDPVEGCVYVYICEEGEEEGEDEGEGDGECEDPMAYFTAKPSKGDAPLTVVFKNLSDNMDGWTWDFGDGSGSDEYSPVHVFNYGGDFITKLSIWNECGEKQYQVRIRVNGPAPEGEGEEPVEGEGEGEEPLEGEGEGEEPVEGEGEGEEPVEGEGEGEEPVEGEGEGEEPVEGEGEGEEPVEGEGEEPLDAWEADVTPRGDVDGRFTVTDWVMIGRFAAGLEKAEPGIEFQKADCAPYDTGGDGHIDVADWVQAGRYASGLDPKQKATGPTEPID